MIIQYSKFITDNFCELQYLGKVLDVLKTELCDDYNIVIKCMDEPQFPEYIENKKNVVIYLSDELGRKYDWFDKCDIIFKTYGNNLMCDYKKIFPIPCGYNAPKIWGNIPNTYIGELYNKKPLSERKYDIFYSGQRAPSRLSFINNLYKIENKFNNIIQITNGWKQGFNQQEYYNIMNETKIALVPNGAVIPESFRYFESFESGCVVITTYPIKSPVRNLWYYQDSPAIFLQDWNELTEDLIKEILNDDVLNKYDVKNLEYYKNKISSTSTAYYMLEKIKNI